MSYFNCSQCKGFVTRCPGTEGSPRCTINESSVSQGCRSTSGSNCCEAYKCVPKYVKKSSRSIGTAGISAYLSSTQPPDPNVNINFNLQTISYIATLKLINPPNKPV